MIVWLLNISAKWWLYRWVNLLLNCEGLKHNKAWFLPLIVWSFKMFDFNLYCSCAGNISKWLEWRHLASWRKNLTETMAIKWKKIDPAYSTMPVANFGWLSVFILDHYIPKHTSWSFLWPPWAKWEIYWWNNT